MVVRSFYVACSNCCGCDPEHDVLRHSLLLARKLSLEDCGAATGSGFGKRKEAKEREDLLSQLDDQDKEVYGSLSNDQLRKHLSKEQKPQTAHTNTTQPIRDASGKKIADWTTMTPQEKRDNWGSILKSYTNKK